MRLRRRRGFEWLNVAQERMRKSNEATSLRSLFRRWVALLHLSKTCFAIFTRRRRCNRFASLMLRAHPRQKVKDAAVVCVAILRKSATRIAFALCSRERELDHSIFQEIKAYEVRRLYLSLRQIAFFAAHSTDSVHCVNAALYVLLHQYCIA